MAISGRRSLMNRRHARLRRLAVSQVDFTFHSCVCRAGHSSRVQALLRRNRRAPRVRTGLWPRYGEAPRRTFLYGPAPSQPRSTPGYAHARSDRGRDHHAPASGSRSARALPAKSRRRRQTAAARRRPSCASAIIRRPRPDHVRLRGLGPSCRRPDRGRAALRPVVAAAGDGPDAYEIRTRDLIEDAIRWSSRPPRVRLISSER